jgi:DNA gyrase subunit A
LAETKKRFSDERRTEIAAKAEEIEIEDLIAEEDMVITVSHAGYIKRLGVDVYRKQKRGGKGVTAMETKDEDFVEHLFVASSKDYLLIFSNKGIVRWLKAYEIPIASRSAKGKNIVNLITIGKDERINSIVAVKEFSDDKYIVAATAQGNIKKTKVSAYGNPRKGGIVGVTLEKDDELVGTEISDGNCEILLATKDGKAVRFHEKQIRDMGRGAKGVRGVRLGKKDVVVSMQVLKPGIEKTGSTFLSVTSKGFAKRTNFDDYRLQSRGGKGIININVTDKNGFVVRSLAATPEDEIMTITKNGMVVRCSVKDIRETGRNTQGVRLISLEKSDEVSSVASVVAKAEEEE